MTQEMNRAKTEALIRYERAKAGDFERSSHTLYTLEMNGKQYRTTRYDKAWDFCLRFGGQMVSQEQTTSVIDGIEYVERSWRELYDSVWEICRPKLKGVKGQLIIGNQNER